MKSETTLIWQWLRINVPTILAIGGLVWYTAENNATTNARLQALETSSSGITSSVNALVARVKSVINATGLATGLPATQINRAVDGLWRRSEGEGVAPLEYLLGKSKK